MKTLLKPALILSLLATLGACETIGGLGKDITNASEAVKKAAS